MNTIHDMGGMHGFGPVVAEADEPTFHAPWEGRVLAMQRALGFLGLWTIDMARVSQEMLPPLAYLGASYYKRWFLGLEHRVLAHGLLGADEIAAGRALRPGTAARKLTPDTAARVMSRGEFGRPPAAAAKFKPGDRVRTRNLHPVTHTRLPRYARDKTGMIEAVRGCHVFPDAVARGAGEEPHWLYTVVFAGRELWGEDSDPALKVSIEAFEPYLVPA
jgi:nitrile hydratase subunit beta